MARILEAPVQEFIRWFAEETKEDRETGRFASLEENIGWICRRLGLATTADRIARAAGARRDFTRDAMRPRPDAAPTLRALRSRGPRLGLISDCCEIVPPLWDASPLAALLDATVFSCQVALRKPDPRIYHTACRELDVDPIQCLYVGDGGSDELSGALNSGMRAALLVVEAERSIDPYRLQADRWRGPIVTSLTDMLKLV